MSRDGTTPARITALQPNKGGGVGKSRTYNGQLDLQSKCSVNKMNRVDRYTRQREDKERGGERKKVKDAGGIRGKRGVLFTNLRGRQDSCEIR